MPLPQSSHARARPRALGPWKRSGPGPGLSQGARGPAQEAGLSGRAQAWELCGRCGRGDRDNRDNIAIVTETLEAIETKEAIGAIEA